MRYALLLTLALLAGCSATPYDAQFCTLSTVSDGVTRCHSWEIGPSKAQQVRFSRG